MEQEKLTPQASHACSPTPCTVTLGLKPHLEPLEPGVAAQVPVNNQNLLPAHICLGPDQR